MLNGFPDFNWFNETYDVNRNPGHKVKPKGNDGNIIDLFNFFTFHPQYHCSENHTENHAANRKKYGKAQGTRPNTGGNKEHTQNDK